jgi:hypothetical protein
MLTKYKSHAVKGKKNKNSLIIWFTNLVYSYYIFIYQIYQASLDVLLLFSLP